MKNLRSGIITTILFSFLIFNILLTLKFYTIISFIPDAGALLGPGGPFLPRPVIFGFIVPSSSYIFQYDLLHSLFLMFLSEKVIIPLFAILSFLSLTVQLVRIPPKKRKGETSMTQLITVVLKERR